jgi:hypothetical protein
MISNKLFVVTAVPASLAPAHDNSRNIQRPCRFQIHARRR